ncbi:heat shock protein-related [Musa troglodytarum]|uniref:Heat shock protein-related n=1 Tax=Musa troglodytarum TaxID=320322 RepID=A0A9E7J931_9LILI|nr:heat shock protein-related [Musa troglodytarum]
MRAGLSTIQQTLTPEAASVLTQSIAEAARRSHGQTTPLHVAATLLAAPSGLLRQACIRSHPQSSHPLQCRALDLCFSVALDRLPASNSAAAGGRAVAAVLAEPPISNALMAALKRAQANQRRGCPEQQQQPLLAVKVELEQLLMSILDDPSVSRVMREASFSSTAVKSALEQSVSSSSSSSYAASSATAISSLPTVSPASPSSLVLGLTNRAAPCRNLYMNPRLNQHQENDGGSAPAAAEGGSDQPRTEDVKRVVDILLRSKKRNPILVGDCNLDAVMREVLQRIKSNDAPSPLRNTQVVPFAKEIAIATATPTPDHSQVTGKIKELSSSIESMMRGGELGVILDLGDLKWLVESPSLSRGSGPIHPPKPVVSEAGRAVVEEMGRLLKKFEDGGRVWLVGAAVSATYLRCQVYHPTMENDWDLQVVPIAPRSSLTNMFPRLGSSGILSRSVETLAPMKGLGPLSRPPENTDPPQRTTLCPVCTESHDCELAKLVAKEFEKYSTKREVSPVLPQWLQLAKLSDGGSTKSSSAPVQSKEEELRWKQCTEELLRRWCETCSRLHPSFHQLHTGSKLPSITPALSKPLSVLRTDPPSEPKLNLSRSLSPLRLESNQDTPAAKLPTSPPGSPVKTDLVLGSSKVLNSSSDATHKDRLKDFTGCMPNTFSNQQKAKVGGILDIDAYKRLFKGLTEKVSWQQEAASAVATVVLQCKSGNGKRRSGGTKGDTWLLLIGPDRVGKRKMANALSELMFGNGPTVINFGRISCTNGNDGESNLTFRGRTSMDRIVEAVQQNPFSVIVLEDIDRADMLLQGKIKQAIERGRLSDSYGRDVNLGSVIFVLTADWLPEELKNSYYSLLQSEKKILDSAYCGLELELTTGERPGKRRPTWVCDNDQLTKLRKESHVSTELSLDLNLAVGTDVEAGEGSWNSSDLTTEHEHDKRRLAMKCSTSSLASELVELVDEAVTFKPVDFVLLKKNALESLSLKFTAIMGKGQAIRVDEDALDRIVGGAWLSGAAFDDWAERVLIPSLRQLRDNFKADGEVLVLRLSARIENRARRSNVKDWLPTTVAIYIDGGHDI